MRWEEEELEEALFWPNFDCLRGLWEQLKLGFFLMLTVLLPFCYLELFLWTLRLSYEKSIPAIDVTPNTNTTSTPTIDSQPVTKTAEPPIEDPNLLRVLLVLSLCFSWAA